VGADRNDGLDRARHGKRVRQRGTASSSSSPCSAWFCWPWPAQRWWVRTRPHHRLHSSRALVGGSGAGPDRPL